MIVPRLCETPFRRKPHFTCRGSMIHVVLAAAGVAVNCTLIALLVLLVGCDAVLLQLPSLMSALVVVRSAAPLLYAGPWQSYSRVIRVPDGETAPWTPNRLSRTLTVATQAKNRSAPLGRAKGHKHFFLPANCSAYCNVLPLETVPFARVCECCFAAIAATLLFCPGHERRENVTAPNRWQRYCTTLR